MLCSAPVIQKACLKFEKTFVQSNNFQLDLCPLLEIHLQQNTDRFWEPGGIKMRSINDIILHFGTNNCEKLKLKPKSVNNTSKFSKPLIKWKHVKLLGYFFVVYDKNLINTISACKASTVILYLSRTSPALEIGNREYPHFFKPSSNFSIDALLPRQSHGQNVAHNFQYWRLGSQNYPPFRWDLCSSNPNAEFNAYPKISTETLHCGERQRTLLFSPSRKRFENSSIFGDTTEHDVFDAQQCPCQSTQSSHRRIFGWKIGNGQTFLRLPVHIPIIKCWEIRSLEPRKHSTLLRERYERHTKDYQYRLMRLGKS